MRKAHNRIANLPPKEQKLVILPRGRIPPLNQRHDDEADGCRNILDSIEQKQRKPRVKELLKMLNNTWPIDKIQ